MRKNVPILDLNNYQSQGNIAIDMVAEAIIHDRKQGLNPTIITLNKPYYAMLTAWVEFSYGKKTSQCDFFLDGVNIQLDEWNKGRILQTQYYQTAEA